MYGTIILLIANALVKVIGAVFKIPLTYILGPEGMGYFSTSYQMYTWMFIIATAGLPVAISKMVSESSARGNLEEVRSIFRVSFRLLASIGIVGSAVLFFGADFFAEKLLKNAGAANGIRAIAPSMLFVSLMSAYRGYFQGHQNMVPTAFSEVVEALGKLVVGFALAYILSVKGMEIASAGAVFGVSCGSFLGFLILLFIFAKKKKSDISSSSVKTVLPDRAYLKKLIKIAVPITIGASVFSLTSLIDMAMIMRRLQAGGFSQSEANILWGSYSGYAFPLFNLPPTLINAITVSIVPAVASAFAKKDYHMASSQSSKSLKITTLFSLPCAVGMSILSKPILNLVYSQTHASETLEILSLAIVFVSLVLVTNAILQATGNVLVPVKNMLIGGVIKIVVNYILVANPGFNIKGAPIGTTLCYVVILALNLIDMKKRLNIRLGAVEIFFKPLFASIVMAASIILVNPFFENFSRLAAALIPIVFGMIVYLIVLAIIKGINEDDLALFPKSETLIKTFRKLKIIR